MTQLMKNQPTFLACDSLGGGFLFGLWVITSSFFYVTVMVDWALKINYLSIFSSTLFGWLVGCCCRVAWLLLSGFPVHRQTSASAASASASSSVQSVG